MPQSTSSCSSPRRFPLLEAAEAAEDKAANEALAAEAAAQESQLGLKLIQALSQDQERGNDV